MLLSMSYVIKKEISNTKKFVDRINQYPNSVRITETCWLLNTSWYSTEIYEDLKVYIDSNDCLFVSNLKPGAIWCNAISRNTSIECAIKGQIVRY